MAVAMLSKHEKIKLPTLGPDLSEARRGRFIVVARKRPCLHREWRSIPALPSNPRLPRPRP